VRFPSVVTAGQIAELVGGSLVGQQDLPLAGIAPLDRADAGDLSLLASRRHLAAFHTSTAGAVLTGAAFRDDPRGPGTRIVVEHPARALSRLVEHLAPVPPPAWGIDPSARIGRGVQWSGRVAIGPGAVLGRRVHLGNGCVIGVRAIVGDDVTLGTSCRIGDQCTIDAGVSLGDGVVVRPGARVGGPGFGFVQGENGHERLLQLGRCVVGDDVEIGANTTIDRGSLGDTVIGAGTKIDNLVQIAHNVRIGARCVIMAQAGVAGSTIVEDDVMLAGQAGLADHLTVGKGARVAAQSGVIGDIPPGATVSGYPARDHRAVLRQTAALARLAPLVDDLERTLRTP